MQNSEGKLSEDITIIWQQDIQRNSKHLTQSRNITGGQDFESLSKTMSKDVEHVNNSKLTEIQRNQHSRLKRAKWTRQFASCSMDLITDLPPINGCNSILVVVDRGNTKGAILIPTTKTLTQEGAGQLLLDNLYKQSGLPDKMLSDWGPQFASKAFRKLLKIKSNLTMAYHPQTDGATKQVN
jgi:hypothetical protein